MKIAQFIFYCLIIWSITIMSCSYNNPYLTKNLRKPVYLDSLNIAYETNYSEIIPLKQYMTYIGSVEDYHIIRWWIKIDVGPGSYYNYAIPYDQFSPLYPFQYGQKNSTNVPSSPIFDDDEYGRLSPFGHDILKIDDQNSCCIVYYRELFLLRNSQDLIYGGSVEDYHLIFQNKSIFTELEGCECYAISINEYTPQYEFNFTSYGEWKNHEKSPVFNSLKGN
ncbi:MAG: hypothetical protein HQ562_10325 [Candidatus Marinimicrobia bacterium]|nr:hypothetical protein [Candidatus Neomarinimicrobiota bacterium]